MKRKILVCFCIIFILTQLTACTPNDRQNSNLNNDEISKNSNETNQNDSNDENNNQKNENSGNDKDVADDKITVADDNEVDRSNKYDKKYLIRIDKQNSTLVIFEKDSVTKEYTRIVDAYHVSLFEDLTYYRDEYYLDAKKEWNTNKDNSYSQYASRFDGDLYIKSAKYEAKDKNTLLLPSYNNIGKATGYKDLVVQANCAYFIYSECEMGTKLEFVEGIDLAYDINKIEKLDKERYYTDPTDIIPKKGEMLPYRIYVEKGSFMIVVYGLDNNGEYTIPIKSYLTAVGKTIGRTPVGEFPIIKKERWHSFPYPYDGGFAQYASYFHEKLMIHSPVYASKDVNSMNRELYNEIGQMKTAGCLRTTTEAAYWIYSYCEEGTIVEIVNGSPKELEKTELPPISDIYMYTDPTDPFGPKEVDLPARASVYITDGFDNSNIRKGPGTNYEKVGMIKNGTEIIVLSYENGWYKFKFNGQDAYIIASYVNVLESVNPSEEEQLELYASIEKEDSKLLDIRSKIQDINIDLLFSKEENFTNEKCYDHCYALLQEGTLDKLKLAADIFRKDGYRIIVYDAYRPYSVQQILYELIKDPKFIADPQKASHHNRGSAVDIALETLDGKLIEFPSKIHTFDNTAYTNQESISELAKHNVEYMVQVMESVGFYNYQYEWWHFSDEEFSKYPVSDYKYDEIVMFN